MGKKQKALSPEEEAAKRAEEIRAVHGAYLDIYKDLAGRRATTSRDYEGAQAGPKQDSFPIPTLLSNTVLLTDPAVKADACDASKYKPQLTAALRRTRSKGDRPPKTQQLHMTVPGGVEETEASLKSFFEALQELYIRKPAGLIEELLANLQSPVPEKDRVCLVADIAGALAEMHSEAYPNLGPTEILCMCLFTMEGADIDRLLLFADAPLPYVQGDKKVRAAWRDYAVRNSCIRDEVSSACFQLYSDPGNPEAQAAASRWIKFLFLLLGCVDGVLQLRTYKAVTEGLMESIAAKGGTVGLLSLTPSCVNPQEEERKGAAVLQITAREGIDLKALSQYPLEQEFCLPMCAALAVRETRGTLSTAEVLPSALVGYQETAESLSSAVAEARVSGQWLQQIASLRAEHDDGPSLLGGGDDDDDAVPWAELSAASTPLLPFEELQRIDAELADPPPPCTALAPAAGLPALPAPDGQLDARVRALCARVSAAFLQKKGGLLDELVDNLQGRELRGTPEHRKDVVQRVSTLGGVLERRMPGVATPADCVALWLTRAHGAQVDSLMGFEGVPAVAPNTEAEGLSSAVEKYHAKFKTHEEGGATAERNARPWGQVCAAVASVLAGEASEATWEVVARWCKLVVAVASLTSNPVLPAAHLSVTSHALQDARRTGCEMDTAMLAINRGSEVGDVERAVLYLKFAASSIRDLSAFLKPTSAPALQAQEVGRYEQAAASLLRWMLEQGREVDADTPLADLLEAVTKSGSLPPAEVKARILTWVKASTEKNEPEPDALTLRRKLQRYCRDPTLSPESNRRSAPHVEDVCQFLHAAYAYATCLPAPA